MKLHSILTRTLLAGALLTLATTASQAALITWGAAQNIAGDSDVSTNGTLVGAFNLGATGVGNTTVNGVTFTGLAVTGTGATSGNFSLFKADGFDSGAATPTVPLSAPYALLLTSLVGDGLQPNTPFTLTMSSLVAGQSYEFQWWSSLANLATGTATATAGGASTLDYNTTNAAGGIGQFAIGSFVADGTGTQVISFTASEFSPLNGFQLRTTAVPEPTTALFGLALVGFCTTARRRRAQAQA